VAKFNKLQNNFKSGQLSGLLDARSDLKEYMNGVKTMKNAYPMKQGGAQKRPGTEHIVDITTSLDSQKDKHVRLFPFTVSDGPTKYMFALPEDVRTTFAQKSRNVILKEVGGTFQDQTINEYAYYDSLVSGSTDTTLRKIHSATYSNELFFARGFNSYVEREQFQSPAVLYRTQINRSSVAASVDTTNDTIEFRLQDIKFDGQDDVDGGYININSHGLKDGQRVLYTKGTTDVGGLATTNYYFVHSSDKDKFKLETAVGLDDITLSDGSNDEHKFTPLDACPFEDGYAVKVKSDTTLPTGLSNTTTYYVKRVDNDRVEFHLQQDLLDARVNITAIGSGIHTVYTVSFFFKFNTLDAFLDDANGFFTLSEFERRKEIARPYQDENITSIEIQLDALTGTNIRCVSTIDFFVDKHVGAFFKIGQSGKQGIFKVSRYIGPQEVKVDILVDPDNTLSTITWQESHWNNLRGYPGTVTTFEGRLCWGGTEFQPGKIWFSKVDDITVYMVNSLLQDSGTTATDDSGLNFYRDGGTMLASDPKEYGFKDNISKRIAFLSEGRALEVGTNKDVKVFNAPEGVGAGAPFFTLESETGALSIPALRTDQSTLYIEALLGLSNFTLDTNIESRDRYLSKQLGVLNDEILEGDVQQTYFDYFRKIAYIIVKNNSKFSLKGLHFDDIDDIAAWFEVDMTDALALGNIKSIGGYDEDEHTYILVERFADKVYFEKIVGAPTKLQEKDLIYLDSHKSSTQAASTTISGLSHLDGEDITVVGKLDTVGMTNPPDDPWVVYKDISVSGGSATLPAEVVEFKAGLPYEAELETMLVDGGLNVEGSSQGQVKRVDEVTLRMWNTTGVEIGDSNATFPVKFDNNDLYSGDRVSKFDQGSTTENRVKILSKEPYPMFLTGIIIKGVTYE
jgi:hypothetical protein